MMRHTLYFTAAGDDKRTAYSFILADHNGLALDSGVFLAIGVRRHDEAYNGHIALQRALRQSAKHAEVASLHIAFDGELFDPLAYEIMGVNNPPLYPSLCRTTQRIIARFDRYEIGGFEVENCERPVEAAVIDNALQALEDARTLIGRLRVLRDRVVNPTKIINGGDAW